jgi:hypothetical protein
MTTRARLWTRRLLGLAVFLVGNGIWAQDTGKITGLVQGALDGKPVPGAWVTLLSVPGVGVKPYNAQTTTASDGTFVFTQVPAGTFQVCPQAPNSALLAPCSWQPPPPQVKVTTGQSVQMPAIQMTRGILLLVRIDDPTGVRAANDQAGSGVHLQVGVRTPATMVQEVPVMAKDSKGYDQGIYVPADTPLEISVFSSSLVLADGSGAAVSQKNGGVFPIQVSSGAGVAAPATATVLTGPTPTVTFRVTGKN